MLGRSVGIQALQHGWLNIVSIDNSLRTDNLSDAQTIEAGAGADVADEHAGFKI